MQRCEGLEENLKLNEEKQEKLLLEEEELHEKGCLLWGENVPILGVKSQQKVPGLSSIKPRIHVTVTVTQIPFLYN